MVKGDNPFHTSTSLNFIGQEILFKNEAHQTNDKNNRTVPIESININYHQHLQNFIRKLLNTMLNSKLVNQKRQKSVYVYYNRLKDSKLQQNIPPIYNQRQMKSLSLNYVY